MEAASKNIMGTSNALDDADGVEKVLTVVVKRRKTIPIKCLDLEKQTTAFEIQRLENAKILLDEDKDRDDIRKVVKDFKRSDPFQFSLEDDLQKAEKKLEKYYRRALEINNYLKKRKKF